MHSRLSTIAKLNYWKCFPAKSRPADRLILRSANRGVFDRISHRKVDTLGAFLSSSDSLIMNWLNDFNLSRRKSLCEFAKNIYLPVWWVVHQSIKSISSRQISTKTTKALAFWHGYRQINVAMWLFVLLQCWLLKGVAVDRYVKKEASNSFHDKIIYVLQARL